MLPRDQLVELWRGRVRAMLESFLDPLRHDLVQRSAQAVFLTVFVIVPSFVLSGVMFPYQSMPNGIREIGAILPLRWYQIGLRRLVLRGGDFGDVWVPFVALCVLFAVLLTLVRWRMKPRLG